MKSNTFWTELYTQKQSKPVTSNKINNIKTDLLNNSNENNTNLIEEHEVFTLFTKLKTNKACGPDGISGKILKTCARELSFIYQHIFNMSIENNIIPDIWKTSKITSVPKSNTIKQMNDLRPIALTSLPMKCLEKLILKRLLQFDHTKMKFLFSKYLFFWFID